jgi:hypothetical protein
VKNDDGRPGGLRDCAARHSRRRRTLNDGLEQASGHGRTLKRNPEASKRAPKPTATTEGSTEPASDDEYAIVVPASASGEAEAGADETFTGKDVAACAVGCVVAAPVLSDGTTPPPGATWPGATGAAPGLLAAGLDDTGGGGLTTGSSAPSRLGTAPS